MIKRILLYTAFIFCGLSLNAQYRYVTEPDTTYLFSDDSVTFNIPTGIRGQVSWQKKNMNGTWDNLTITEGQENFKVEVLSTGEYRVQVAEGTCLPVYSDTMKVGYATGLPGLLSQGISFDYLINKEKIPVKTFLDEGVAIADMLELGLPLDSLMDESIALEELLAAGVTVEELLAKNVGIAELFAAKVGVGTFLSSGVDSATLENEGLIGTATDQEGGTFHWVKIGNQVWMSQNLTVTHYRNMVSIATSLLPDKDISGETNAAYYWAYEANSANAEVYGYLYTFDVATDANGVCPTGWHVPTKAEFDILIDYVGDSLIAGGALKEAGTTHWSAPNTGATNASGFTFLPNGVRNRAGSFSKLNTWGYIWTSSAYSSTNSYWIVTDFEHSVYYVGKPPQNHAGAIRCVKD